MVASLSSGASSGYSHYSCSCGHVASDGKKYTLLKCGNTPRKILAHRRGKKNTLYYFRTYRCNHHRLLRDLSLNIQGSSPTSTITVSFQKFDNRQELILEYTITQKKVFFKTEETEVLTSQGGSRGRWRALKILIIYILLISNTRISTYVKEIKKVKRT